MGCPLSLLVVSKDTRIIHRFLLTICNAVYLYSVKFTKFQLKVGFIQITIKCIFSFLSVAI